jgi:beta-carotene isomerase
MMATSHALFFVLSLLTTSFFVIITPAAALITSSSRIFQQAASLPPNIYESASSIPNPPPLAEPFTPSLFDNILLSIFRWTLQYQSGVSLSHIHGFDGMMAELHELRHTKGQEELERVSLSTMTALAGPIPFIHRILFVLPEEDDDEEGMLSKQRTRYPTAPILAWFAKYLLPFLVGDMTLTSTTSATTTSATTTPITAENINDVYNNNGGGLLVERCRVLERSNCKGICTKMCKVPTQRFFAERWGIPLSMEPNFETGSCQLRFGVEPTDLEDDLTIPPGFLCRCPAAAVEGGRGGGCD